MRKMLAVALMLSFFVVTAAAAQEVMTNQSVTDLIAGGLGEQTVIAKIKSSPSSFDVSGKSLIALKRQGLSDAVIAAMVDASAHSQVSAAALGASDSPDPRAPHAPGIYLLSGEGSTARMVRIDATSSNQTKTGGFLGYALTGGIAKMKINTVLPSRTARVRAINHRPTFYFFFDQANASLSGGAPGGFWLAGPGSAVTSPNEFSLVRFKIAGDHREASVGSFNLGGAKAGIQDNQRVAINYVDVRPGVFEVKPGGDLPPGEYGFVYSSTTGGGVGAYGAGATMSRIFDFSVGADGPS